MSLTSAHDAGPLEQRLARTLETVAQHTGSKPAPAAVKPPAALERIGRGACAAWRQAVALLGFVGESALALAGCVMHPARLRWRPILYNIRSAGFEALPIIGLLSFLLGIVIAYQGADQLRRSAPTSSSPTWSACRCCASSRR